MSSIDARRRAIGKRVATLAKEYSQAELARRTGVSRINVSRYVRGTRIPSEFLAELADSLELNPSWLLLGEGSADKREVAEDTQVLAGNLLELVKAIAAVEHTQLGALAGKHHLTVLRELGDALSRLESLRERLNRHSAPLLKTLLGGLRDALDKRDLDRAEELARTAQQLGRLCDEPDLLLELTMLQSRFETLAHGLTGALDLTRRAILLAFHRSGQLGERELEAVTESVTALHGWHRYEEAHQVAKGVMALATDEVRALPVMRWLTALTADMHIQSGNLSEGLRILPSVRGALTGARGQHTDLIMARGLLLSGSIDVETAIGFGEDSREKGLRILGFAVLQESPAALDAALKYWTKVARRGETTWLELGARLMLRGLRGERGTVVAGELRKVLDTVQLYLGVPNFAAPIYGAQVFRLIGNNTEARALFREADRVVSRLPDWFSIGVMWLGRHNRNALYLGTKKQQTTARTWFGSQIRAGYRCFAGLEQQPA